MIFLNNHVLGISWSFSRGRRHKILPTLYILQGKHKAIGVKGWNMKHRIRVIGIIRRGDEILLLKKIRGRAEELPSWELPTGKIRLGEQPEEAMGRAIYEHLTTTQVASIKLKDVVTFVNLLGASRLGNLYIIYEVELETGVELKIRDRYSAYKFVKVSELSSMRLDDATISVLELGGNQGLNTNARNAVNGATVYVDGGSRGNPGPAGVGYYIVGEDGRFLKKGGEFIGFATSRVAEYFALKEGCHQAIELGLKRVRFVSDNLMMVNQMNGIYRVKNRDIIPIYNDVKELLKNFEAAAFVHVKRELNTKADLEVNIAINRHFGIDSDKGMHSEE